MKQKTCGIYRIICTKTGRLYVGSSCHVERRLYDHRRFLNQDCGKANKHLQNAWNKYGEDSFIFEVIEECEREKLLEREEHWINYYNSLDEGFNQCVPSRPVNTGVPMPDEQKKKVSDSLKEYYKKADTVHPQRGKHLREETKEKISKSLTGRKGTPCSDENRQKLSEARRGKNNPMYGVTLSVESRQKSSKSQKAFYATEEGQRIARERSCFVGAEPWNKGKKLSEETRRKMREAHARRKALKNVQDSE